MSEINPDVSPVLIEAVYWRYSTVHVKAFDSIEQAVGFLEQGEEYGSFSPVGIFVNGEPHTWSYDNDEGGLTPEHVIEMRAAYARAEF